VEINVAVGQMDKVMQGNAASAEQSASAAEELNAQAGLMKQSVAELLQLLGGDSEAGKPATSPVITNRSRTVTPAAKLPRAPAARWHSSN